MPGSVRVKCFVTTTVVASKIGVVQRTHRCTTTVAGVGDGKSRHGGRGAKAKGAGFGGATCSSGLGKAGGVQPGYSFSTRFVDPHRAENIVSGLRTQLVSLVGDIKQLLNAADDLTKGIDWLTTELADFTEGVGMSKAAPAAAGTHLN